MNDTTTSIFKAGELALTYRRTEPDGKKVTNPDNLVQTLRDCYGDTIEVMEQAFVIGLSRSNNIRSIFRVSTGGAAGTVIDPKIVFSRLLLDNCSAFILSHNHPSGNRQPSDADKRLTHNFVKAGIVLDLPMLDHIIVTTNGSFSFASNNLM